MHAASKNELELRASALTYLTLISLIPSLAVIFAIFNAFGGLEKIRDSAKNLIFGYIVAGNKEQVVAAMNRFIENIHSEALGAVGVVALFVVAIMLLWNVEGALNRIWGVRQGRSVVQRFAVYWILITFGPILLGLSLAITASLRSSTVVNWLMERFPLGQYLFQAIPIISSSIAFTLLYLVMPNTKVRALPALIAGTVTGVVFELMKWLYTLIASTFFSYNAIYGALGAIPILIIWISWAWRVVLLGAQLCNSIQNLSASRNRQILSSLSRSSLERLAWGAMVEMARALFRGQSPLGLKDLAARLNAPALVLPEVLKTLVGGGLILPVQGDDDDTRYLPSRAPNQVNLFQVVSLYRDMPEGESDLAVDLPGGRWLDKAESAYRELTEGVKLDVVAQATATGSRSESGSTDRSGTNVD